MVEGMMRVVQVMGHGRSQPGMGGGHRIVFEELSRALAKHIAVLEVAPAERNRFSTDGSLSDVDIASLINKQQHYPILDAKNTQYLDRQLTRFMPDMVHLHDYSPLTAHVLNWAIKRQIPVVTTVHMQPSKVSSYLLAELVSDWASPIVGMAQNVFDAHYRHFIDHCSAVIVMNEACRQELVSLDSNKTLFTLRNGIDIDAFGRCGIAVLKDKPIRLCFLGHLCERKNQAFLIEMMHYLDDQYELVLVGDEINKGFAKKLARRCKGIASRVEFVPAVSYNKVPDILSESHFFVSASTHEVQSLVILEALASGTPVIALENETTSTMIDDAVGALLSAESSPEVFASAVRKLAQEPQKDYEKRCHVSRQRVQDYDWSAIAEETLESYEQIITEKSAVARNRLSGIVVYVLISTLVLAPLYLLSKLARTANKAAHRK